MPAGLRLAMGARRQQTKKEIALSPIHRAASLVLLVVALAARASATSFAPVADRDLASQADVIAVATVVAAEAGPADRAPATDYVVTVEQLVQGELAGGTIVVRVPGGISADGLALKVDGAPQFTIGETTLLFLRAGDDGTYATLHLMLGAFHARAAGDALVAEQDLPAAVRAPRASRPRPGKLRPTGAGAATSAASAAGSPTAPLAWSAPPTTGCECG